MDIDHMAKTIQDWANQVSDEAFPDSLDDAAEEITDEAKDNAPVSSGTLRDSLTYERDGLEVSIGPSARVVNPSGKRPEEYGEEVELQEPFLRPAIDNAEPKVNRALKQNLENLSNGR